MSADSDGSDPPMQRLRSMFARRRCEATLARWLGPWADERGMPPGVLEREATVPGQRPLSGLLLRPRLRAPRGGYIVAPGLQPAGTTDPRLRRFAGVLARAGFAVAVPKLADYVRLRVEATVHDDFARFIDFACAQPEFRDIAAPHLLAISFGVLPGLRAGATTHADLIGGMFVFGGYADFGSLISYTLSGEADGERNLDHDPLDLPVVFINLADAMSETAAGTDTLIDAWGGYVRQTWGRPEMRRVQRRSVVANAIASSLPASLREVFLVGCGLRPGAAAMCREATARLSARRRLLDPCADLGGVRCPVWLAHGRDDDVIPYTQLQKLAEAFPPHVRVQTFLTGLFTHAAGTRGAALTAAASQARTMLGMLGALSSAAN